MNTISSTLSLLSLAALFTVGCGSTQETTETSAPSAERAGYGYEFPADAVTATPPIAHGDVPALKNNRVAPEHIRDVVRQAFPALNACYAAGVAKNPSLAGQVTVRFVIGGGGRVESVGHAGSHLADEDVVNCVADTIGTLAFPSPRGSIITVVYPLAFSR